MMLQWVGGLRTSQVEKLQTANRGRLNGAPKLRTVSSGLMGDVVRFRGAGSTLAARYGIDVAQLAVVAPPGTVLSVPKEVLVEKLLEAHEHARKNKLLGNYSDRYYSSNLLLENGTWGVATNIENSRDRILCGERSAMVAAWNKALEKLSLRRLERATPEQRQKIQDGLQVKLLTFAQGSQPESSWDACAECLSWMATRHYFKPDTQLAYLKRDQVSGQLQLRVGTVQGHLPYADAGKVPTSSLSIGTLQKFSISPKAQAAIATTQNTPAALTEERMRGLLSAAKQAYETNTTAHLSGKRMGAAVLLDDGRIVSGARFDWTQRWNTQADLVAAIQGFQQNPNPVQTPLVVAVAYYGDDPATPAEPSLGPLSQGRGNGETLLIKIEDNDTIHVRTLRDYMPYVYISSKVNRKV